MNASAANVTTEATPESERQRRATHRLFFRVFDWTHAVKAFEPSPAVVEQISAINDLDRPGARELLEQLLVDLGAEARQAGLPAPLDLSAEDRARAIVSAGYAEHPAPTNGKRSRPEELRQQLLDELPLDPIERVCPSRIELRDDIEIVSALQAKVREAAPELGLPAPALAFIESTTNTGVLIVAVVAMRSARSVAGAR